MTSPADRDMGDLQKIMYVHVPAAWITFLSFFVVLVFSVRYLLLGRENDDLLAASAAEVGATFNGLTLMLGMIWGRPAWGVWWVWDARLTSTLVLFLIFVGYLALRAFVDDQDRRAQWSAAVGMFGAINVPIVYMSVRWWRTLHQIQSSPSTMDPAYVMGLRCQRVRVSLRHDLLHPPPLRARAPAPGDGARGRSGCPRRAVSMANNNWSFVVAAYAVTWIVLLGYAVRVHRMLARARQEAYEAAAREGA